MLLSLLLLLAPSAFADESPTRFSLAAGPAWVHVLRDNYAAAYTANGFSAPGRDRVGLELLGYWTTDTHWQLGLGMTAVSMEQDIGTTSADYGDGIFGLYVAHNFVRDNDSDITFGALVGLASAQLTIFSANQNGRVRETSAVIAPSIGYAARVSELIKLGVRGSYVIPFGESVQTNGQNLGVSRIGEQGFQIAALLIFGR